MSGVASVLVKSCTTFLHNLFSRILSYPFTSAISVSSVVFNTLSMQLIKSHIALKLYALLVRCFFLSCYDTALSMLVLTILDEYCYNH